MTGEPWWSVDARAKINRWLRIVGKRPDGYHELVTLFQELDWGDHLYGRRRAGGVELTLRADGPRTDVGVGDDNLVARAARAWLAAAQVPWGIELHLHKRIPAGAGLGGGSSDAAATLRLLQAIGAAAEVASALDDQEVFAIAAGLGADVPFFLRGGTQVGLGTGTELRPVAGVPPSEVLLVLPPFGCNTRRVYENFRPHWIAEAEGPSLPPSNPIPFNELAVFNEPRNDLHRAALAAYPALGDLTEALGVIAGRTDLHLSGSGSALFVTDSDGAALDVVAAAIRGSAASDPGSGDPLTVVRSGWSGDGQRGDPAVCSAGEGPHGPRDQGYNSGAESPVPRGSDTRPSPDRPTPERAAPDRASPNRQSPARPAPGRIPPVRPSPERTAPDRPSPDRPTPDQREP